MPKRYKTLSLVASLLALASIQLDAQILNYKNSDYVVRTTEGTFDGINDAPNNVLENQPWFGLGGDDVDLAQFGNPFSDDLNGPGIGPYFAVFISSGDGDIWVRYWDANLNTLEADQISPTENAHFVIATAEVIDPCGNTILVEDFPNDPEEFPVTTIGGTAEELNAFDGFLQNAVLSDQPWWGDQQATSEAIELGNPFEGFGLDDINGPGIGPYFAWWHPIETHIGFYFWNSNTNSLDGGSIPNDEHAFFAIVNEDCAPSECCLENLTQIEQLQTDVLDLQDQVFALLEFIDILESEFMIHVHDKSVSGNFTDIPVTDIPDPDPDPDPEPKENTLQNGGFDSTAAPWRYFTNGSGGASLSAPGRDGTGNAAMITVETVGSNMQLFQRGLTLEPNTDYVLTFWAYSNSGNDCFVNVARHDAPHTNYGLRREPVDLKTGWQEFRIEFTTENFGSPVSNGRVFFFLANTAAPGDRFFFDDIQLYPDVP